MGEELSPPVEEPVYTPSAGSSQDATNFEKLSKTISEEAEKRLAPQIFYLRWQKWYDILRARFPIQSNPAQAFVPMYFSTLNSIGWAGLISASLSSTHVSWLVWLGCPLTIVVVHVSFALNMKQQQYADPSGDYLAAELLKAIEQHELKPSQE